MNTFLITMIISLFLFECVTVGTKPTPTPTPIVVPTIPSTPIPNPAVPTIAVEPSSVQLQAKGFSPILGTLSFNLLFGNQQYIKDWKLEIAADKGVQKTFTDTKAITSLNWDGKSDVGVVVPDGNYIATLSVTYNTLLLKSVTIVTQVFGVASSAPLVSIAPDPGQIVADDKGSIKPVYLTIVAHTPFAAMSDWAVSIIDSNKKEIATMAGHYPQNVYIWNGKIEFGNSVDPNQVYTIVATVKDEFGNTSKSSISLVASDSKKVAMIYLTSDKFTVSPSMKTIKFNLSFGKIAIEAKSWKIEIKKGNDVVRTINSRGLFLAKAAEWDGKKDNGLAAGDGEYTATLTVNYGVIFGTSVAISAPFILSR